MATLTHQNISRAGVQPSLVSAAGGGDEFLNSGKEYLEVTNGGGGSITVTIETQATVGGNAVTDDDIVIGAGETHKIGPFPPTIYNDNNGFVQVTYSGVASVTVGVFRMVNIAH